MTLRRESLACAMLCFSLTVLMLGCGRAPEKEPIAEAEIAEPPDPPLPRHPDIAPANLDKDEGRVPLRTVAFMGARGTGRRFCIIADHSESLSPASLGQIKKEISTTLRSLDETTPFYVIFFAKTPSPMPADNWRQGTVEIEKVENWMTGVHRIFGTLATPAFRKAMTLQPRPDVVFLMTDGQLGGKEPAGSIAALNTVEPKTVIHTILFSKKGQTIPSGAPARVILETIARNSGGEYRQYVADPNDMPVKKKKK